MSGPCSIKTQAPPPTAHLDVFMMRRTNGSTDTSGVPVETPTDGLLTAASLNTVRPELSGNIATWSITLTEATDANATEHHLHLPKDTLKYGVMVFLRESETYMTDPDPPTPRETKTEAPKALVNRAVTSVTLDLKLAKPNK